MRVRALVVGSAIVMMLAASQTAGAQEGPRPVIDHAPAEVGYRGSAVIRGHMENGAGSEEVSLLKNRSGSWSRIRTQTVDDEAKVAFRLDGLTRTADYRLMWKSPDGEKVVSEGVARIRVAARVVVEVARHHVMSGRKVRLQGWVLADSAGREVVLEQKVDGAWRFLARRPVNEGQFDHEFRVASRGDRTIRAIFRGDDTNAAGRDADSVKVYSRSYATWYGPGLYGNRTACGRRLQRDTLGVAHRSLPCGTEVDILYEGRTISVPVIDRGPYSGSADYDLTEETADRLRFRGSDTIGTAR